MKIHPSAIVSPQARLADDVEVGPGAIIGDEVTLGAGCVVKAHAVIQGRTTLGEGNVVGIGAVIGEAPQDFSYKPEVVSDVQIGDRNVFREYVTIHLGTKEGSATVVGNDCYLMVGAHLGHNVRLGNNVVIANACHLAGYVDVADRVVLGGGTVFHQFMRIGTMAMVRGGTRFGQDIPPYAMGNEDNILSGINTIGLRRGGFSSEARLEIKRAYKIVYSSGLNTSQALAEAEKQEWSPEAKVFFDFIRASKRGICPMAKRGSKFADADE